MLEVKQKKTVEKNNETQKKIKKDTKKLTTPQANQKWQIFCKHQLIDKTLCFIPLPKGQNCELFINEKHICFYLVLWSIWCWRRQSNWAWPIPQPFVNTCTFFTCSLCQRLLLTGDHKLNVNPWVQDKCVDVNKKLKLKLMRLTRWH